MTALTADCTPAPPKEGLPSESDELWYRDQAHANFVATTYDGSVARIAHLDTGYDPNHATLPGTSIRSTSKTSSRTSGRPTIGRLAWALPPTVTARGRSDYLRGEALRALTEQSAARRETAWFHSAWPTASCCYTNSAIASAFGYVYGLCKDPATLSIYPHALCETNAYYSSSRKALLFGYFVANKEVSALQAPGTMVFTALSHDIIAHETTHALLDGIHCRYLEPTNQDVLVFHEGFADIVALFQ